MPECTDARCPFHGSLRIRGQVIVGRVVSAKTKRTAIIEVSRTKYIRKYKRYARVKSRIPAHNPDCISAKEGDLVRAGECRKISRTKAFCIIEIIKRVETEV